jgi:hypothetical protein
MRFKPETPATHEGVAIREFQEQISFGQGTDINCTLAP